MHIGTAKVLLISAATPYPLLPIFDCDMLVIFSAELKGCIIGYLAWHLYFLINKKIKVATILSFYPHKDKELPFPYHYKTSPAFLEMLKACVLLAEAETRVEKMWKKEGG